MASSWTCHSGVLSLLSRYLPETRWFKMLVCFNSLVSLDQNSPDFFPRDLMVVWFGLSRCAAPGLETGMLLFPANPSLCLIVSSVSLSVPLQDVSTLTPLSPEIISRQATINIGTGLILFPRRYAQ